MLFAGDFLDELCKACQASATEGAPGTGIMTHKELTITS
jgi:hypothetical protein